MPESEEGDEVEIPDFVPLYFSLPRVRTVEECPKCGVSILDSITEFHPYGILNAPCGRQFDAENLKVLGEHVCRVCLVCGHGWAERVGD
jgi:hypothetical protein